MGRASILKSIQKNKPTSIPLPNIDLNQFSEEVDLLETFKKNVELVGGKVQELTKFEDLDVEIKKLYPNAKRIVSEIENSSIKTINITNQTSPHSLENIDLAIIKGEFGVAENGAIWISEKQFSVRILPFITNDLIIVLPKEALCFNMHQAYKQIAKRDKSFGLFLSGPSKTADIEQCLVIGAQGAMSLTIFVY